MIGAHMSIAGGLMLACDRAAALGCETMQIFTKNERQWKARPITDDEATAFRRAMADKGLRSCFAHDTYLHNLASPNDELWRKSLDAYIAELIRCEQLGLSYLVSHPGSPGAAGKEEGIARMRRALKEALAAIKGFRVRPVLETSAGQGACLGCTFDEMAAIAGDLPEIGFCFDTCHVFAAGYDLRTRGKWDETMDAFDRAVGLGRLVAFHVNDSKKDLGCRVDRHENLGMGCIGLDTFRFLMTDPRFADLPKVLETPKENDMDAVNLDILRKFRSGRKPAREKART